MIKDLKRLRRAYKLVHNEPEAEQRASDLIDRAHEEIVRTRRSCARAQLGWPNASFTRHSAANCTALGSGSRSATRSYLASPTSSFHDTRQWSLCTVASGIDTTGAASPRCQSPIHLSGRISSTGMSSATDALLKNSSAQGGG